MTYIVDWKSYFSRGASIRHEIYTRFIPNNGELEQEGEDISHIAGAVAGWDWWQFYKFSDLNSGIVAKKDLKHTVRLDDVYFSSYVNYDDDTITDRYFRNPDNGRVLIEYIDGTYLYIDDIDITASDGSPFVSVSFSFTPEKDVNSIELQLSKNILAQGGADVTRYVGEYDSDVRHKIIIDQSTEEAGLLDSILGFIKTIKDTLINLPSLIWEKISSGLQALFIPSDDYITTFKEDMDVLLSSKLGAIYEVVDLTFNSWDRIQQYDEVNTVLFPVVTIPLPDGESFSFGGYDVKIVPDGFGEFVELVKKAVGLVCTVMFVNGLKRKYDGIIER